MAVFLSIFSGRWCYPKEFEDDAARMVIELDKPIAAMARDLGIHKGKLGK